MQSELREHQMSIFTQLEYDDFDARPSLDDAWNRLPIVRRLGGLGIRWLGPFVNLGHDQWMGELAGAAWGHLEGCGWQELLRSAGAMLDGRGRVRTTWSADLRDAVYRLSEDGARTGPEGDPDRWASWVCFEMAEPHQYIRALAEKRGWDR